MDTAQLTAHVTDAQADRLGVLIAGFKPVAIRLNYAPFDLPPDYLYVVLTMRDLTEFHCGIGPDGAASS